MVAVESLEFHTLSIEQIEGFCFYHPYEWYNYQQWKHHLCREFPLFSELKQIKQKAQHHQSHQLLCSRLEYAFSKTLLPRHCTLLIFRIGIITKLRNNTCNWISSHLVKNIYTFKWLLITKNKLFVIKVDYKVNVLKKQLFDSWIVLCIGKFRGKTKRSLVVPKWLEPISHKSSWYLLGSWWISVVEWIKISMIIYFKLLQWSNTSLPMTKLWSKGTVPDLAA